VTKTKLGITKERLYYLTLLNQTVKNKGVSWECCPKFELVNIFVTNFFQAIAEPHLNDYDKSIVK